MVEVVSEATYKITKDMKRIEQGALHCEIGESLDREAPHAGARRLQRGDEMRRGGRPNRHPLEAELLIAKFM